LAGAEDQRVRVLLSRMSVADKIGQLFVTYVYGGTPSDPAYRAKNLAAYGVPTAAAVVDKYRLGGVIYFDWAGNLRSPRQIAGLSNGLQKRAMAHNPGVPLVVSIDQEGGVVTRLDAPVVASPGNMAVGATFSAGDATSTAAAMGQQLRALGINTDDAPVVDLNSNPTNEADGVRSFGDRSGTVARLAAAAVRGFGQARMAATVKHFPGLGGTTANTDDAPALTTRTRAQLLGEDLAPFSAAIAAGAQLVMTGHVVAPALDPTRTPASLSEPIVTGLLRGRLHYDGVVTTDSLEAGALSAVPPARRAVRAIQAGNDVALMPASLPEAVRAVTAAVRYGTISAARLDASVARILRLKLRLGLFDQPYVPLPGAGAVGTSAQAHTMAGVARRSITLLRNAGHVLPLRSSRCVLLTGWGSAPLQQLTSRLAALRPTRVVTGRDPSTSDIARSVAAAKACDRVVVTTSDAWGDAGQRRLVSALLATGRPIVVAALAGPYDAAHVGAAPGVLAAYGSQPASIAALADVLLGARPTGRLPVTVSAAYPYGFGLRY
jgi:beta-N-acetylhexosaminidase